MPTRAASRISHFFDALAGAIHAAWAWWWFVTLAPYWGLRQARIVRRELAAYAALDAAQIALLQNMQGVFYRPEEASANRRLLELPSPAAHQAADEALLAYFRGVIALERRDLAEPPSTRRHGTSSTVATG